MSAQNQHTCTPASGVFCCCDRCCTMEKGCGGCATACTGCACCPPMCIYGCTCIAGWCATCCYCCHCGFSFDPWKVLEKWSQLYAWCTMWCIPCCVPKENFEDLNKFVYGEN